MRHIRRLLILIICAMMLTTVVYAASTVENVQNYSTISSDGSCAVSTTINVYLDSPAKGLSFPLPAGSTDVTMNGSKVRTTKSASGLVMADLSSLDGFTGEYTLSFQYSISSVLKTVEDEKTKERSLVLELPLLSSFSYPVEYLEFSVTFPSEITAEPAFSSGYLGSSVESLMSWKKTGFTISGNTTDTLQDMESLVMTMNVTEEMFPGKLVLPREGNPETLYMGILTALAALYWLLMMRCLPIIRQYRTTPPEGITAGEVGSRLSSAGVDLTMMVFSWAQLGYVRIRPDKQGRVWLDKRMDMGNERTDIEVKLFRSLFSRYSSIDGTGSNYAKLCLKAAQIVSGAHEMYRRKAGNIMIFRIIFLGVSLLSGICFGMNLIPTAGTGRYLLSAALAVVGVITGWGIQNGMFRFHIRGKTQQHIGAVCLAVWLTIGGFAGEFLIGLWAVGAQMIAGFAAAYGGRRSSLGRLQASQILGLRHYLKHIPHEELEQIMDANPDYFFDMLPYAIALGVDGAFARRFSGISIPQCSYLTAREDRSRSAREWAYLLRKTADKLDKRQRQMQIEKWTLLSLRDTVTPAPARQPAQPGRSAKAATKGRSNASAPSRRSSAAGSAAPKKRTTAQKTVRNSRRDSNKR